VAVRNYNQTMELPIIYAIPAFVLLIAVELFINWRRNLQLYETRDSIACIAMGLGNVIINSLVKAGIVALYLVIYEWRIFDLPVGAWWVWLLLFFAEDLCYYLFHRFHHESRFGWAAHVNHHSSQRYNLAVALRQSWTTPITGFVFWAPLPLLGFHPAMILVAQAISLIYQFWIHTEVIDKLPRPLEWIMNTPSHHRVHHGSNPQYIDRNYAGILIIWDRLFGSFEPEGDKVKYGLTKNIQTYNPIKIAFHEWSKIVHDVRHAKNWRDRWDYIFRHPGWQPPAQSSPD